MSLARGLYELLVTRLVEEQLRDPALPGTPDADDLRNAEAADRIGMGRRDEGERKSYCVSCVGPRFLTGWTGTHLERAKGRLRGDQVSEDSRPGRLLSVPGIQRQTGSLPPG